MTPDATDKLIGEFIYKAVRSSGPGGQNVNKVSTKVEVRFNLFESKVLNPIEIKRITTKLRNSINSDGSLIVICQESRSQLSNKAQATQKMLDLIAKALVKPKKRVPTKPSAASKRKRLENKKRHSEKKSQRRWDL